MLRTQAKAIVRDLEKKMVLLSGPRQVGKSYVALSIAEVFRTPPYLNRDNAQDRTSTTLHSQNPRIRIFWPLLGGRRLGRHHVHNHNRRSS